jgi:hypothetical protein
MWFLLLAGGAVLVQLAGIPLSRRLAAPPAPELLLAGWFLLATAVRLAVMRVRIAGFERKAARLARRQQDKSESPIGELGLGVGRGALQVVGGDVLGASLSLVAALLRGAAGTLKTRPAPARERRQSAWRERLATVACVLGVGFTCTGLAWWPLVGREATRAAEPALRQAGLVPTPAPAPAPTAAAPTIGPRGPPPPEPAPAVPAAAVPVTAPETPDRIGPARRPPATAVPD